MLTRRALLATFLVAASRWSTRRTNAWQDPGSPFAALEKKHGGRLGVSAATLGTGRTFAHRADERFAMCSTFKLLVSAQILSRVDRGEDRLDRHVTFSKSDFVPHSPVTEKHVASGMTVDQLCEATMTLGDNTAANLLLAAVGGPAQVTRFVRSLGDTVTRLDRMEPELNAAAPGDVRDTTSPAAMAETLRKLVLGDSLSAASRSRLTGWLVANKTGDNRLRAGLPRGWRVGDRTGTGNRGATNDIAVAWPPDGKPLVVAVYYDGSKAQIATREKVIADVARIISAE